MTASLKLGDNAVQSRKQSRWFLFAGRKQKESTSVTP